MSIKKSYTLYKLFNTICTNDNIENLSEDLKIALAECYDISEINVLYFDEQSKKLKNVIKNFEPAEDYFSEEKYNVLFEIFETLKTANYVLNDDKTIPQDVLDIVSVSVSIAYPIPNPIANRINSNIIVLLLFCLYVFI